MKYNLTINPPKCYWPNKRVNQNGQTPNTIRIYSYCVLNRSVHVFGWTPILLHPEPNPWWSFLFTNGAHYKKPHSPTHPHVPNEHEDLGHDGLYVISSEIIPCYNCFESLVGHSIAISVSCLRAVLALISMSLWAWRFRSIWPVCKINPDIAMLQLSCKFGGSTVNIHWV